jgi:large subunit ribosomal protein L21
MDAWGPRCKSEEGSLAWFPNRRLDRAAGFGVLFALFWNPKGFFPSSGILRGNHSMDAYAVVETGGKQYMVRPGMTLQVELLPVEAGAKTELSPVLALSDGQKLRVGTPDLADSKVTCTVLKHIRGKKVVSFKKQRRKGYRHKRGHRQDLTILKVESI